MWPLLLAQEIALPAGLQAILSVFSAAVTSYFWFVKARQERPDLRFHQLMDFQASLRRGNPEQKTRRLALTQVDSGGVLIANNSIRQNSILRFDCFLRDGGGWIKGHWGYVAQDKPPWNIPPQSAISLSMACFFDVPEAYEVPQDLRFRVEFVTTSGKRFSHVFSRNLADDS
jgi:hypothetical protein